MKLAKRLLKLLVIVAVLLVGIAYLLPREVSTERSIVIERPAAAVFTLLASMNRFNEWSPWYGRDPDADYRMVGPEYGVGAGIAWKGNQEVGEGAQTIIAMEAFSRIDVSLDFGAEGPAQASYHLRSVDGGTEVVWSFNADMGMNPVGRYFGLLMDKFLGPDYEQGLQQLKALAEKLPDGDPAGLEITEQEVAAQKLLYVVQRTEPTSEAVSAGYASAYTQIVQFMAAQSLQQAAAPVGIESGMHQGLYQFDAAIPVTGDVAELVDPIKTGQSFAGKVLKTTHVGPYSGLQGSTDGLRAYAAARGIEPGGRLWYSFVDDPTQVEEEALRTEVFLPIK